MRLHPWRCRRMALVVFAAASVASAQARDLIVHAGHLIDGLSPVALGASSIIIKDDRIESVQPGFVQRKGYEVIDLSRDTVLPGLIDLHTHLSLGAMAPNPLVSKLTFSRVDRALFSVRGVRATLEAGFTSVRDVGGVGGIDIALKRAIENHEIEGPRMWVAGPILSPTGGHSDARNGLDPELSDPQWDTYVADGVDEFVKAVRRNKRDGADLIKIADSGGTGSIGDSPKFTVMSEAEIRAVVDAAHHLGMKVAVHAQNKEAVDLAVRSGVDSIEHGAGADAESYRLMKEHGTYLVPTMLIAAKLQEAIRLHPDTLNHGTAEKVLSIIGRKRERTCEAYKAGIKIGFGTDVVVDYGTGGLPSSPSGKNINAQEFALLVAACMTPMDAIFAATRNAADLIGSNDIGAVRAGRYADLVAVANDPLGDITELERPVFVMKGGEIFRHPQ